MLYADRVQETTTTVGVGALTLGGAVAGFRTFSAEFANNENVRYAIAGGTEWETGDGTYASGTLTRNAVYSSSNGGALVNFSAGTKTVWSDLPAIAIADVGLTYAFFTKLVNQ